MNTIKINIYASDMKVKKDLYHIFVFLNCAHVPFKSGMSSEEISKSMVNWELFFMFTRYNALNH